MGIWFLFRMKRGSENEEVSCTSQCTAEIRFNRILVVFLRIFHVTPFAAK